jgi:hypothetical protein
MEAEREKRNGLGNTAEEGLNSVSSMSTDSKKRVSQEITHITDGEPPNKKYKMAESSNHGGVRVNLFRS